MIFIVLSSLATVHDTVQHRYCIFSLLYRLLRIRLKRRNPLLSYVRERKYTVNVQCSVQYTVNVQCSVQYTVTVQCTVQYTVTVQCTVQYTVTVQCSVQYTLLLLYLMLIMSYCV
jgi:hypothetical protein